MRGALAAIVLLAALTGPAHADRTPADVAFQRGRELLANGKYAEACAAFDQSLQLDFQFGTLFNLAQCNEKTSYLAKALAAWRKIAKEDRNIGRAQKANANATALEPRVPRLQIRVAHAVDGVAATIDGIAVVDLAQPTFVDLGKHEVVVTAPGRPNLERTVDASREGETVTVDVDLAAPTVQHPTTTQATTTQATTGTTGNAMQVDTPPHSSRATAGKVMIALGAATMVTGGVFGVLAYRSWHDAEDKSTTDVGGANSDLGHVRLLGNVSTALLATSVVALAVGVYLWRSGSHQTRAAAIVVPGHATVGMSLTF